VRSFPNVLLLDEPTTGVDPVPGSQGPLAHLAGQGLTVLVYAVSRRSGTRIASLIHLGEIRQIGTPDEIRQSLQAKRIELRASDLRKLSGR
jgi:ABC-type lipopolysaccharide export system ATPase subunit